MGQAAPAHQALSGPQLERGEDANLVRCGQLRADCKCLKGVAIEGLFLNILQILSLQVLRKNPDSMRPTARGPHTRSS